MCAAYVVTNWLRAHCGRPISVDDQWQSRPILTKEAEIRVGWLTARSSSSGSEGQGTDSRIIERLLGLREEKNVERPVPREGRPIGPAPEVNSFAFASKAV